MESALQANLASSSPIAGAHGRTAGYWSSMSAEGLIESFRGGESVAFEELRRRFEAPVFRMAYDLAKDRDSAEDIAQDSFLKIHRALRTFKNSKTLRTWIYCVVRNVFLDCRRSNHGSADISLEALLGSGGEVHLPWHDDTPSSPQHCAEAAERNRIVRAAISALPDFLRGPLTLSYYEDQTYDEIAAAMQIPVGTVKSRLHRARRALRKLLDASGDSARLLAV